MKILLFFMLFFVFWVRPSEVISTELDGYRAIASGFSYQVFRDGKLIDSHKFKELPALEITQLDIKKGDDCYIVFVNNGIKCRVIGSRKCYRIAKGISRCVIQ